MCNFIFKKSLCFVTCFIVCLNLLPDLLGIINIDTNVYAASNSYIENVDEDGDGIAETPYQNIRFTSNDSWTVPAGLTSVDVFLVGGGGGGVGGGYSSYPEIVGNGGGGGGYTKCYKNATTGYKDGNSITVSTGQLWTVTIGNGGNGGGYDGGDSSISHGSWSYVVNGGKCGNLSLGGNGGSGGGNGSASAHGDGIGGIGGTDGANGNPGGNGQGHTTRMWGDATGALYSGGGGGGDCYSTANQNNAGAGGGGSGAFRQQGGISATAGSPNTGGGGGGGVDSSSRNSKTHSGKAGGSGIVIIRYPINSIPTINVYSPASNQGFTENSSTMNITGTMCDSDVGNIETIYYRIDGFTGQSGTQLGNTITANGSNQAFSGSTNISGISEGSHTLYAWVQDNKRGKSNETAIPFVIDRTYPVLGAITTSSSYNSITISGSATDNISLNSNPYQYTMGYYSSGWVSVTSHSSPTYLSPNSLYAVKFEACDALGHISNHSQSTYTKAQVPSVTISNPSSYTLDLATTDNNPSSTQYQIIVNNTALYVTPEGAITSSPIWLTLPSKAITVSGLSPNTTYSFQIKAKNAEGIETVLSNQASGTTLVAPPGSPTNIVATATNNSITVMWNAAQGSSSYDIEVDGTVINNSTNISYFHSGLNPNTPHTYRVRAINQGGYGNWSAPITKSTVPGQPTPPLNINAAATDTKVIVTWDAVPGASGYDIEVNSQVINNGSSTNYVHAGLFPGTTHAYRVRSINSGGKSPWSNEVLVTTQIDIPTIPGNIQTEPGKTQINISWNSIPGATGYDIEADGFIADAGSRTTYTHSSLLPGTEHTYRVRAKKYGMESNWSALATASTLEDVFGTPTDFIANATENSISLNWTPVADATGYDIEADGIIIDNGVHTSCVFVGFVPNTGHAYRVRARNGEVLSDWTQIINKNTYVLPTPRGISATSTEDSLTAVWGAVNGADGYEISLDGNTVGSTIVNSYTIGNLIQGNQYYIKIRATDSKGTSAWSEAVAVTTIASDNAPPVGMFAMIRDSFIRVIWSEAEDATSYDLDIDGTVVEGITSTSYLHDGLSPGTPHTYKLRVIKGTDIGEWSGSLSVTTLSVGPVVPGNVTASTTMSSVLITWDAVENASSYDIEVDNQVIDAGQSTFYLHNGLIPNSQHSYKVRSRNSSETSTWSQLVTVTTSSSTQSILLDCITDDVFNLALTASNLPGAGQFTFTITYDTDKLELIDLCGTTPRIDLTVGGIIGTDLQVVQFEPGTVVITKMSSSQGQGWSGILGTLKFKSKATGQTSVSYSLN